MTQAFRPALIGLLPALAVALLLALLLSGRLAPAIPISPSIELPGIGITPSAAPAAPADAAPVIENTATTPPSATTVPGPAPAIEPSATAAPGAKEKTGPGPGRLVGDQEDPWPYPNLPNGKGPASQ